MPILTKCGPTDIWISRAPMELKIEFCRMKLRKSKFLDCDEKRHLANLDGINLHKDNLMFYQKARDMKKKFFDNIIESQSFANAALPTFNFNIFLAAIAALYLGLKKRLFNFLEFFFLN